MESLEMTLLFDYYGELLTQRQRDCLDMRYNQDMSLGEIAQELGVSRQGVYDNLNRAEILLRNIEEKTGFLRRDAAVKEAARRIAEAMFRCLVSAPMSLHSSSLTILTIIWAGVRDSNTSVPTQRSVTDLVKSFTTL